MSESNDTAVENRDGKSGGNRIAYTLVGAVVVLLIVIVINYIAGLVNLRADLTENKVYTLS